MILYNEILQESFHLKREQCYVRWATPSIKKTEQAVKRTKP